MSLPMEFGDWMAWGATDDSGHDSGVRKSIRADGPQVTIARRVQSVTLPAFGKGSKLGIWLPRGTSRSIEVRNGGQIPGWSLSNDMPPDWDDKLIQGVRYARSEGVEVVFYVGGLDWMSMTEWYAFGDVVSRAMVKTIIVDTLCQQPASAVEADRVQLLHMQCGMSIGSEFPQKFPSNADFGFARDMTPNEHGGLRGAQLAQRYNAIPNGQELWINHSGSWERPAERIAYWRDEVRANVYLGNMANAATRAHILTAMNAPSEGGDSSATASGATT